MGALNNRIDIEKLKKGGGSGDIEERLEHLEDEYTALATYSEEDDVIIGEWYTGQNVRRKIVKIASHTTQNEVEDITSPIDGNYDFVLDYYGTLTYTSSGNKFSLNNGNNVEIVPYINANGKLLIRSHDNIPTSHTNYTDIVVVIIYIEKEE